MFKSKLQEVCQQKRWSLPEYKSTRVGLDHCSRFSTTVTINGLAFSSANNIFRSSKEAQNSAAELAYHHFSNTPTNPIPSPASSSQPTLPQVPTVPIPSPSPASLPQPTLPQIPTIPIPSPDSFPQPTLPQIPTRPISSPDSFPQPTLPQIPTIPIPVPQPTLPGGHPASSSSSEFPSTLGTDMNYSHDAQVAKQTFQPMNQETHQTSQDIQHLYKNQLQTYAQKRNLLLPVYYYEQEGPPHARRFKSRVTIDGQTYEGQEFLPTMKDAGHAAAKAALMSLLPTGVQEDDSRLYKNLLQELLQKEGCSVPVYVTHTSGQVHMPIFVSTVEIQGENFTGQVAKSKKLAEMSAAKVAYDLLKERKSSQIPLLQTSARQGQEASKILSSSFESNPAASLQQVKSNDPMILSPFTTKIQTKENTVVGEGNSQHPVIVSSGPSAPTTGGGFSVYNTVHGRAHEETKITSHMSQKGLSSTLPSDCSTNLGADLTVEPPAKRIMYDKVSVYPCTPNMKFPEGTIVLPMSNEKWVALSHT